MLETFILLLLGHLIGDFLIQTNWMIARKSSAGVLTLHVALVTAVTALVLGAAPLEMLAILFLTHLLFDALKIRFDGGFSGFLIDQGAHIAVLIALAGLWPTVYATGLWGPEGPLAPFLQGAIDLYPQAAAIAAGLIATLVSARYGIEIFMEGFTLSRRKLGAGLRDGGRYIGLLERALVFLFVMMDQFAAIGFLIAAKSVLRFGVSTQDRAMGEYVIIGTLLSFGWAIATASLTHVALVSLTTGS